MYSLGVMRHRRHQLKQKRIGSTGAIGLMDIGIGMGIYKGLGRMPWVAR